MKPGITSGKKISNSPSFQKGRQYRMEVALRKMLIDNGFYWAKSPMSRKKEHFNDRLEFNSILTLTDILGLHNVKDWHERVKLKQDYILANPEVVHWDFAEHIPLTTRPTQSSWKGIRNLIKVSTEGEIRSVGKWGMRRLKNHSSQENDYYVSHKFYDGQYMLHRITGDRHSHRGCSWKYITLKEAVNYPQGLSKGGVL